MELFFIQGGQGGCGKTMLAKKIMAYTTVFLRSDPALDVNVVVVVVVVVSLIALPRS
jgi:MinD superfamily P-loop ATPase